jgi:hypothetical protein
MPRGTTRQLNSISVNRQDSLQSFFITSGFTLSPQRFTDHVSGSTTEWTLAGARTAWRREITFEAPNRASPEEREKAAAMNRLREQRIVFHGLRKNAVIMLLERFTD